MLVGRRFADFPLGSKRNGVRFNKKDVHQPEVGGGKHFSHRVGAGLVGPELPPAMVQDIPP
jgi:hypothetical protein